MAKNQKRSKLKTSFPMAPWLFIIYFIVLIYITFFAWNYGASLGPIGPGGRNYNIQPLLTIKNITLYSNDFSMIFRIIIGNILLFIPFGFLFPFVIERFKYDDKPVRIIPITIMAMFLSFFIELNQFAFTYRVANIDDIILNTTGGFIGVILYRIFRLIRK
ncbi:VanZ family protein [Evansella sp. AB-rgal1]|uniref:VanZ family protein n=1 Tax=Evansella sp. AB-rgal1 TaxID=3242696 RepID=UPI00359D70CE